MVELFEDINLPKDIAELVAIPEHKDEEEADIDETEWLRAAAANAALTQFGYGTLTAIRPRVLPVPRFY